MFEPMAMFLAYALLGMLVGAPIGVVAGFRAARDSQPRMELL
jgi:hypothetical protein